VPGWNIVEVAEGRRAIRTAGLKEGSVISAMVYQERRVRGVGYAIAGRRGLGQYRRDTREPEVSGWKPWALNPV
jgi:hypothetical protein